MKSITTPIKGGRASMRKAGFTLLELLMVIAVISTVAAMGIVQFKDTSSAVRSTKLQQDVAALNRAVRTYAMSGGDLSTARDGKEIIAKLKSVSSGAQRSRIAGLRGSMLDHRLLGVPSTENGTPRAVWNSAKKTFFVQDSGDGFHEFVLDEMSAAAAPVEDTRNVTLSLDGKDKWIWGFADGTAGAAPRAAPDFEATTGSPVTPRNTPNEAIRTVLNAPGFSIPGGTRPLRDYDLSLRLTNSNPPGVSEIYYSVNGGSFQRYAIPLVVAPHSTITALCRSLDLDNWNDSPSASRTYSVSPVPLQLAFSVPKLAVTYQEVGGRMIPGSAPLPAATAPGWASLTNLSEIPAKYQNNSVFAVRWTYDKSDPLKSSSALAGAAFAGGFPGQAVATSLANWGRADHLRIRVVAASQNPALTTDSPGVEATLTAVRTTLRPPLMRLDPTNGNTILSLDTAFSDMPEGAILKYSVPESSSSTPKLETYTGPVAIPGGKTVTAWVYPPDGTDAWFNRSNAATLVTPMPLKLAAPVITLSNAKFDHLVNTITITLTNPNPAGSSGIQYVLKQPTDAYPARTEFLPYTGPFNVTSSFYPNGFQIQAYARSLFPLKFEDSPSSEAATTADFFGMALTGDVFLIIDASGSMSTQFANTTRFKRVIDEAVNAINTLGNTQKFGVITFSSSLHWSDGSEDLRPANSSNKQAATEALKKLVNAGGTNYEIGLKHALNLRTKPQQIVFLSDGQPNYANYLDDVAALKALGIKISTIGIGNTESQSPLREIASLSGGAYRFVMVPGSAGTLQAPRFSIPGGTLTYDKFPVRLSLTNPNGLATSYISYTINAGPAQIYTGPFNVPYNSTVEASCESIRDDWAPSTEMSQTYVTKTFTAGAPVIKLSAETFTDLTPQITLTLENPNPAQLTNMVWWFETDVEANAKPYTRPIVLDAAEWNSFASQTMDTVTLYVRTLGTEGFVYNSVEAVTELRNGTSAFLANLSKPALKPPVFSIKGGTLASSSFPVSLTLSNPNPLLGELMVSINGEAFAPYTGPLSVGFRGVVSSYIQTTVLDAELWRDSLVVTQTYHPQALQLATPTVQASATTFTPWVKTITVTLRNPNAASLSKLIYWFEGQNPATDAIAYTGPFNLTSVAWETYALAGRADAKLVVQAVGTEDFCKPSTLALFKLTNQN